MFKFHWNLFLDFIAFFQNWVETHNKAIVWRVFRVTCFIVCLSKLLVIAKHNWTYDLIEPCHVISNNTAILTCVDSGEPVLYRLSLLLSLETPNGVQSVA